MELGKRKTRLESYIENLMEEPEKRRKKVDFENVLRTFYKKKWNAPLKPPTVHGLEFDLFKLYEVVMAFGGWQKVSQLEKWGDVAEQFGIKDDILGGDNAIKILYMRYLSKFEQNETVGDVDDMMDSEMLRSRNRQQSFLATSECPVYVPRFSQAEIHRSTDADYSRLTKSLLSGLPNESDFALNVCTLLSHPGPRLLKVSNAPHIITLILAHIGIFDPDDESMKSLYDNWTERSGRDYHSFWGGAGIDREYLKTFLPQAMSASEMKDDGLFVRPHRCFSSNDPLTWRVYQVATVLRNLSFEPINKVPLAENWQMIKFCVLASNSSWTQLATAALDTLSNIASDLDLSHPTLLYNSGHSILRTISEGLYSEDKLRLIRSMELLAGVSGVEENETILCQFLSPSLLSKIFSYVVVKDIMLCVYTLECIYQISEMGSIACDMLSELPHSIQMLLSLASVEAVSFGPTGLAGMKVVEYHPPGSMPPPQGQHMPPSFHSTPSIAPLATPSLPPTSSSPVISTPRVAPTPSHPPQGLSPAKVGESKIEQLTAQWIRNYCEAIEGSTTSRGDLYAAYVDDMRNIHHSLSGSLTMFTNMIKTIYPSVSFNLPDGGTIMLAMGLRLNKPNKLAGNTVAVNSHPVMKSILEKKDRPEDEENREIEKSEICTAPIEASQVMAKSDIKETPIIRVENMCREEAPLKSTVARKIKEKDEEEEVKKKGEAKKKKETNGMNGHSKEDEEVQKIVKNVMGRREEGDLMCEWDGCGDTFMTPASLLYHATHDHLIEEEPSVCKWPGCDGTQRSKWSLVTHLQDHHASEALLRDAARKRKEGKSPAKPLKYCPNLPREMPQHPGYSRTAAIDAIRRHAFNFILKDFTEEVEGPVTKSIRLTACLILRNIARYSIEGRGVLRRHERLLSWMALSRLESHCALSQLLSELPAHESVSLVEESSSLNSLPPTPSASS